MPLDELSIIERFFRPLAGEGAFALRDDAGRIAVPPECDLVVTTDMVACGVHFLPDDPPGTIAQKALRVNLSDLAAKGAKPLSYTLSLGLPTDFDERWLAAFAEGLAHDQDTFSVGLLGGDTILAPHGPVVSITAFGLVARGKMVHRSGGRPGDVLFVSGTIGAGAAGLALLKGEAGPWDGLGEEDRAALIMRYRVPEPRVALSRAIVECASAAMDVSDGLVGDCDKLCAASGCSASIDADRVPIPPALQPATGKWLAKFLTSGDDYEIMAAVSRSKIAEFLANAAATGVMVTEIGVLTEGDASPNVTCGGVPFPLSRRAYVHGHGEEAQ